MRISILKFVFFSIIICFFEYAKNELYFINKRNVYHERNITNFRNNRILADADNQFDLNDFYQSTLSLANQFNEYDNYVDDEEMSFIRNAIDSHIKKHIKSNKLPDLNNVDKKTKKLVNELLTELEEVKKEINNKRNSELEIQPIQDKRITKKDENNSVSEYENFRQLENYKNNLESEDYNFDGEYVEITASNHYKKLEIGQKIEKTNLVAFKKLMMFMVSQIFIAATGGGYVIVLLIPYLVSIIKKCWKVIKLRFKLKKLSK
ncbi:hypothetical protein YYC_04314 [Plasmodium yoelii 17X]|uniref:Fam-b protein n=4 Tax=Plasmodium yoelii TaxID=5861 RepID=Q7RCL4_PLAYO|nr:fam-b protein [Plasmodium yoelii]EAA17841.1 hypothetical protein [Plasmodium yoelii yoelii]ETB57414.1 hypothetical protein YYC_04314 [Plasmodium yoelii 17X]WBY57095.1 fam-b protein [Plasmodium yoelii yoelii]CDU17794.1 fam-b protein [Plasmodium yoelii]VTZ78211.1 fam-b protein [Plasmodium yoelii]|eukprot:XP_726276.1 fam-b protein [Plasmodium yoelii]